MHTISNRTIAVLTFLIITSSHFLGCFRDDGLLPYETSSTTDSTSDDSSSSSNPDEMNSSTTTNGGEEGSTGEPIDPEVVQCILEAKDARYGNHAGTAEDPFWLCNANQIKSLQIAFDPIEFPAGPFFLLKSDIDVSGLGLNFTVKVFKGHIDGDGHALSGIRLPEGFTKPLDPPTMNTGFISKAQDATFRNLILKNISQSSNADISPALGYGFIGEGKNLAFENVRAEDIHLTNCKSKKFIGLLAGRCEDCIANGLSFSNVNIDCELVAFDEIQKFGLAFGEAVYNPKNYDGLENIIHLQNIHVEGSGNEISIASNAANPKVYVGGLIGSLQDGKTSDLKVASLQMNLESLQGIKTWDADIRMGAVVGIQQNATHTLMTAEKVDVFIKDLASNAQVDQITIGGGAIGGLIGSSVDSTMVSSNSKDVRVAVENAYVFSIGGIFGTHDLSHVPTEGDYTLKQVHSNGFKFSYIGLQGDDVNNTASFIHVGGLIGTMNGIINMTQVLAQTSVQALNANLESVGGLVASSNSHYQEFAEGLGKFLANEVKADTTLALSTASIEAFGGLIGRFEKFDADHNITFDNFIAKIQGVEYVDQEIKTGNVKSFGGFVGELSLIDPFDDAQILFDFKRGYSELRRLDNFSSFSQAGGFLGSLTAVDLKNVQFNFNGIYSALEAAKVNQIYGGIGFDWNQYGFVNQTLGAAVYWGLMGASSYPDGCSNAGFAECQKAAPNATAFYDSTHAVYVNSSAKWAFDDVWITQQNALPQLRFAH